MAETATAPVIAAPPALAPAEAAPASAPPERSFIERWHVGLKAKVAASGWGPVVQRFTEGCRSVFLVCRNAAAR